MTVLHPHREHRQRLGTRHRGFTLFEVALSLVIVTFGVISVLMLFPQGIKAEQLARMRIIAGVKAQEMIDVFATASNHNSSTEVEAPNAWDVAAGYKVMSPDLESRISTNRMGIAPVPSEIARRLDSESDEISKILAEGGQLFYSSRAGGSTNLEETTQASVDNHSTTLTQPDALTQRIVFAVVGYAQSNNLAYLPQKSWPYYAGYPSPPGHNESKASNPQPADKLIFNYNGINIALWEGVGDVVNGTGTTDADMREVFESTIAGPDGQKYGYRPYGLAGTTNSKTLAGAQGYIQSALWYCARKGLTNTWYAPTEPFTVNTEVAARMNDFRLLSDSDRWKYVQAFRFLSHAALCMTRHKDLVALGGQPSSVMGFPIPSAPVTTGLSSPSLMLTHDKILYYHELFMQMTMLYSASQPYDWGAPRPTQRAIFTDHPLIEYDLFSPRLTGKITNTNEDAEQWHPIAARPITNIGRSMEFPASPISSSLWDPANPTLLWGNSANFTLTKPFKAEERCRQLVFWAVDWMSYEDCETAPSGPIDASKYQFAAPMGNTAIDDMNGRMGGSTWPDHHIYQYRNPEKALVFTTDVSNRTTGDNVSALRLLSADGGSSTDMGGGFDTRQRFLGRWGADRNFNGILDRGPLPPSVRLRATAISRYNFYDPRLTLKLR